MCSRVRGQHAAVARRRHNMTLTQRRLNMTLDDFRQSLTAAIPLAELTLALTGLWWDAKGDWTRAHESASRTMAPRVRGCTPTCTARKAIRATRPTGMVEQGSPFAENRSMRNGSAFSQVCWDKGELYKSGGMQTDHARI